MIIDSPDVDIKEKETVIREKFQITLPAFIRDNAKLNVGDILLWEYDENSKTITAVRKPRNFTKALSGLGKHLWKNGVEELQREREQEWQ